MTDKRVLAWLMQKGMSMTRASNVLFILKALLEEPLKEFEPTEFGMVVNGLEDVSLGESVPERQSLSGRLKAVLEKLTEITSEFSDEELVRKVCSPDRGRWLGQLRRECVEGTKEKETLGRFGDDEE